MVPRVQRAELAALNARTVELGAVRTTQVLHVVMTIAGDDLDVATGNDLGRVSFFAQVNVRDDAPSRGRFDSRVCRSVDNWFFFCGKSGEDEQVYRGS